MYTSRDEICLFLMEFPDELIHCSAFVVSSTTMFGLKKKNPMYLDVHICVSTCEEVEEDKNISLFLSLSSVPDNFIGGVQYRAVRLSANRRRVNKSGSCSLIIIALSHHPMLAELHPLVRSSDASINYARDSNSRGESRPVTDIVISQTRKTQDPSRHNP